MSVAVVLAIILALLFAMTYFTRRRFGVLGLALAAGSTLSSLWANDLTPWVQGAGIEIVAPPLASVVAAAIVLLPAVVLLFSGPTYKKMIDRVVGAAAFSLLALAFLLPILGDTLALVGDGKQVFDFVAKYRLWIVTGGLLFAIFDLLRVKTPRHTDKH